MRKGAPVFCIHSPTPNILPTTCLKTYTSLKVATGATYGGH